MSENESLIDEVAQLILYSFQIHNATMGTSDVILA